MFTGLIEELGRIAAVERPDAGGEDVILTVHAPLALADARLGDSIAVSGVCLTVKTLDTDAGEFTADVMPESMRRTALGDLEVGSVVNIERAMAADGRLGGHIVQGHVDGVGTLVSRTPGPRWDELRFAYPAALGGYLVEKGSITVSGVSLTVSALDDETFTVSLIPATLTATTLGALEPGDRVNLEVDVIAKYVERLLARGVVPGAGGADAASGGHGFATGADAGRGLASGASAADAVADADASATGGDAAAASAAAAADETEEDVR